MSFTFFDKFADACSRLNDSDRALMFDAICEYGAYGKEPELPYPLDALFASFADDIDNSKQQRERGNRGGRPRKTASKPVSENIENQVSENQETGLEKTQKPVSENLENQVSETAETTVSQNAKPKPNQTIAKPDQTRESGSALKAAFPPTPAKVREYADAHGLAVDAERFCDYFAAQGWRLANGNAMRDWRAAARNWSRRDGREAAQSRAPSRAQPTREEIDEWDRAGASGAALRREAHDGEPR